MKKLILFIGLVSIAILTYAQKPKKATVDSLVIKGTHKDVKSAQPGMPIVRLDTSGSKYKTPVKITDTSKLSKMPGTAPLDTTTKLIPDSKYSVFRDSTKNKELKHRIDSLKENARKKAE